MAYNETSPSIGWPFASAADLWASWRRRLFAGMAASVMLTVAGASLVQAATYLEKAEQEIARNDPRTAIIHLRNALKENPEDLLAHRLLGKLYLDTGNPNAAEDFLLRAHARKPALEAGVHLAAAHLQLGKARAALRTLDSIERGFDDHAAFVPFGLVKARVLIALNMLDDARPLLESYLEKRPLDSKALVIRAQLDLRTGALDEAGQSVARALDVQPELIIALWTKIAIASAAGRFEEAADGLDRLEDLMPGNPDVAVARAGLLLQMGQAEEAQKRLEALLGERPGLPSASLMLASLAAAEGRFDECKGLLQSINAAAREAPTFLLLSGLTKAIDHQYAIAESFLFRYLEEAPGDQVARRLLANVQLNADFNGMAIATLEPLTAVDTPEIPTLVLSASAQIRAGRLDDAAATLERIIAHSASGAAGNAEILLALLRDERLGEHRHDVVRALDYLHYGDIVRAEKVASALVDKAEDNPTILNLLSIIRFRLGDDVGSRAMFNRILAIDPEHGDARRGLDQLDLRAGNVAAVEERSRARLDRQDGCEPCVIDLASLLFANGRGEEAYALLVDQAALQPDAISLREALITTGIAIDKQVFEGPWLQELIAIGDRGEIRAYEAAGGLAFRFGQFEAAADVFQRQAQALPDDLGPLVALAQAAYRLGNVDASRSHLDAALAIDPGHSAANGMLFDLSMQVGATDLAEAQIERLLAVDQLFGKALLASFYVRSGRPEDGIKIIKEALAAEADPALAHRLFILRREVGDIDGAIAGLRAWLIRRPSDTAAMDLLGDAYIERGALRLGLRYYEQALRLSGEDPFLLNDVAWVRHELGMPGAETFARRAYTIAPLPEIADTLGWIMVRQGQADNGLPLLREAFRSRPANPDIRYHLAYTLAETGDDGAARALLETLAGFEGAYAERQAALDLWDRLVR